MKKTIITIIATVLVCCTVMGGTLAYLMDKTASIENTFTVGKVDIDLTEENEGPYKMIPGSTITKDPLLTVNPGSEACYVFVKIEETDQADALLNWTIGAGWTQLKDDSDADVKGVFYREQAAIAEDGAAATYPVFLNDTVTVVNTLAADTDTDDCKITITGYAVQSDNVADAYAAWQIANT